eukprot:3613360-Heterocapsa_arctica.AAC.1
MPVGSHHIRSWRVVVVGEDCLHFLRDLRRQRHRGASRGWPVVVAGEDCQHTGLQCNAPRSSIATGNAPSSSACVSADATGNVALLHWSTC